MPEHLTQTQRDAFIDDTRFFAHEVLSIPEVQQRLGGYVNELYTLTNSMTSATVEDGKISVDKYGSHQTPTVVLRAGEEALRLCSENPFDARQRQVLTKTRGKNETFAIQQQAVERLASRGPIGLHVFNEELGYVQTNKVSLGDDIQVINRPLLALNYDKSSQPHAAAPLVFHELTHVRQRQELPYWNSSKLETQSLQISNELEGYAVTAMTILGIRDANQQHSFLTAIPQSSIDSALEIEEIRSRANRYETDPYAASHTVAAELIKNGHGITSFLQQQIDK